MSAQYKCQLVMLNPRGRIPYERSNAAGDVPGGENWQSRVSIAGCNSRALYMLGKR